MTILPQKARPVTKSYTKRISLRSILDEEGVKSASTKRLEQDHYTENSMGARYKLLSCTSPST
jgi:hypothetical protein